jgi:hypothetical protein
MTHNAELVETARSFAGLRNLLQGNEERNAAAQMATTAQPTVADGTRGVGEGGLKWLSVTLVGGQSQAAERLENVPAPIELDFITEKTDIFGAPSKADAWAYQPMPANSKKLGLDPGRLHARPLKLSLC